MKNLFPRKAAEMIIATNSPEVIVIMVAGMKGVDVEPSDLGLSHDDFQRAVGQIESIFDMNDLCFRRP
jgi:hypothetical protein